MSRPDPDPPAATTGGTAGTIAATHQKPAPPGRRVTMTGTPGPFTHRTAAQVLLGTRFDPASRYQNAEIVARDTGTARTAAVIRSTVSSAGW